MIEITLSKTRQPGNGTNKNFDYAFSIPDEDYLRIIHTDSSGNENVITSDYSVTGIGEGEQGGTVTYPVSADAYRRNV